MYTNSSQIKVGFIHNAFPVLSETFISKEMIGLDQLGLSLRIYSLFYPVAERRDTSFPDRFPVYYLLEFLRPLALISNHIWFSFRYPRAYFRTLMFARRKRHTRHSLIRLLFFFRKKNVSKSQRQDLLLHFVLAVPLALQIKRDGITFINAHFTDAAAGFAMLAARLLDIEFGLTAHAYDIFTPQYNRIEKLEFARFILTCTRFNKKTLLEQNHFLNPDKITVMYHGIDLEKFQRVDRNPHDGFNILSVGRLVPKKGFDVLIDACRLLQLRGAEFTCRIIGDGPMRSDLEEQVNQNSLFERIEWVGSVPSSDIVSYYEAADVFVLPCVVEADGNRDGIPNVIAEAMAMELPVISSEISGIPELVVHNETGFLLQPHDSDAVARAIATLVSDRHLSRHMGKAGRQRIKLVFDSKNCLERLYQFYLKELGNADTAS